MKSEVKDWFANQNLNLQDISKMSRDSLLYKVMPYFVLEIMEKYFRLEISGTENIPKRGPGIIAPNHSGYSGFDAVILSHQIKAHTKRVARVLTHHFWFLNQTTAVVANKMGFIEATSKNGMKYLQKKQMIILFPEGEYGNFKSTRNAYRLEEFKRGFVRMALHTGAPIIPTLIIGAEETHINLKQIKLTKYLRGVVLPLPLNIIPLPAKWKIIFLEPVHLPFKPSAVNDSELVHEIAMDIQEKMQTALSKEANQRTSVFL